VRPASSLGFPRLHLIPGLESLGLRQRVLERFPFVIVYRVVGDTLQIEAVAHTSREPGYWIGRVK
jgi:hypothetical protein